MAVRAKPKKFTRTEKAFIARNINKMTNRQMAIRLRRSEASVQMLLSDNGLYRDEGRRSELKDRLAELFKRKEEEWL
jgi:hypothetical protein